VVLESQFREKERARLILMVCLSFWGILASWAVQSRPLDVELHVLVLEGEDGINIVKKKTAVKPVVEVRDRNNLPVAGAAVTFASPRQGAGAVFLNGSRSVTLITDSTGRVAIAAMKPVGTGSFKMSVSASFQGHVASATIAQTNYATIAAAASAVTSSPAEAVTGAAAGAGVSVVGILATARAFLTGGSPGTEQYVPGSFWVAPREAIGYGLYSYIVLEHPPSEAVSETYLSLVTSFLQMFTDVQILDRAIPKKNLNVTYLPVRPMRVQQKDESLAQWALANYDYGRAIVLMNVAGLKPSSGPYIISALEPLSRRNRGARIVFLQDLSWVPARLMPLYLEDFRSAVSRNSSWTQRSLDAVMLDMRTVIARLAEEKRVAVPTLADFIRLVSK
jgi:hypothetical protein